MSNQPTPRPIFAELTDEEQWAVLERNHVGRIAFLRSGVVDIAPVHYVAVWPWIYIRSAAGAKLEAFAHHPYVAFEVDEVDALFDWRSVVAHGTVYLMADCRIGFDREAFDRAVGALRSFVPETLGPDDPTPLRQQVYGVHVDRSSGRVAEQRARSERAPLPAPRPGPRRRTPDGF